MVLGLNWSNEGKLLITTHERSEGRNTHYVYKSTYLC